MINLACTVTILINMSNFPWNDHDRKMEERARHVCANDVRYEDTPCLKKFIKKGERNYWAICSVKVEE